MASVEAKVELLPAVDTPDAAPTVVAIVAAKSEALNQA